MFIRDEMIIGHDITFIPTTKVISDEAAGRVTLARLIKSNIG